MSVADRIFVAGHRGMVGSAIVRRLLDQGHPASSIGTSTTAISASGRWLNGSHQNGSSVIWFQSMKSGMPGVLWILVDSGSEASSFRNIAIM